MAGTINYLAPVDNASGKIFGKKEKFVAVTRNWGNRRRGCSTTGKRNLKDHPISQAEKDHRAKFAAVAAMVNSRLADPNQMPLDQLAFKSQSKYKTLRQYVWHICSEEYDKQNAWGGNIGDFFEPDIEQNFGEEIETDRDPDL